MTDLVGPIAAPIVFGTGAIGCAVFVVVRAASGQWEQAILFTLLMGLMALSTVVTVKWCRLAYGNGPASRPRTPQDSTNG